MLPLMAWMIDDMPLLMRIVLIGMVEYSYNVFPATSFSSYVLQSAHFVLMAWLWMGKVPAIVENFRNGKLSSIKGIKGK